VKKWIVVVFEYNYERKIGVIVIIVVVVVVGFVEVGGDVEQTY